ncbi:hypothetical protein [Acrocarpospora catenulata]|uniref:hypothetical protein n=1 Tax=Acrocarpospora catenulata TaxID=2836182 RepID=UPI001BDADDD7|nr:hypothetical protein [Acrocarpospora catenulata]
MDVYESNAWLDWWANPITCLASFEVMLVIRSEGRTWEAQAQLVRLDEPALDAFELLNSDPIFDLRLPDGATLSVEVHTTDETGKLQLTMR